MTISELIKLIEQWAKERELDKYGTIEGQLIKTAEEVAELIIAISKDDVEAIKDAVGDVFVTLVVGHLLSKSFIDLEKVVSHLDSEARFYINHRTLFMKLEIESLLLATSCIRDENDKYDIGTTVWMVETLMEIANYYKLDFKDCIESAYNEIANRKGQVVDGSFVKES